MNRDTVEGNWKQLKGRIKMRWGRLTGDPLCVIAGKRILINGSMQRAYGVFRSHRLRGAPGVMLSATSRDARRL